MTTLSMNGFSPALRDSKRVLVIAPQPFFCNRGTPINVKAVVQHLVELGYEVHLLTLPHGDAIEIKGVTIHRCLRLPGIRSVPIGPSWRKLAYDILLFISAFRLCFKKTFFVLHGIEEGGLIAGCIGLWKKLPYVFDLDSCLVEQTKRSSFRRWPGLVVLLSFLEKFMIRRASAVVTVSTSLTEKVKRISANIPIFQIEDFPLLGSEVIDFNTVKKLREDFNLERKKVFLYTGNFEPYQGIELLLRAFFKLLVSQISIEGDSPAESRKSRFLLLLVGGEESQIKRFKRLVQEAGFSDHVIFMGARPSNEMGAFMEVADVLVSPRLLGGNTPLKIYSYMASGKPMVVTKISAHTAIVNEQCAFLAKPEESDFARLLGLAADDSPDAMQKRMTIAQCAKHLVETRYSVSIFKQRIQELYSFLQESNSFTSKDRAEKDLLLKVKEI